MYTAKEYSQMAIKANEQGQTLYVLVDENTKNETLVIAPTNYYELIEPDTNRTYGKINKQFEETRLQSVKDDTKMNALLLAKQTIAEGVVKLADGIEIETDTSTLTDLNTALTVMQSKGLETYTWIDKNDNPVELTESELIDVIVEIGLIKNNVWSIYYDILTQIEKAETVEDIKAIDMSYNTNEESVDLDTDDFDIEEAEEFEEEIEVEEGTEE